MAIAAVSVVPPAVRPVTILPHYLKHAAIYFLVGCAFGLGYPNIFVAWLVRLSAFTLAIEVAQLWIPGRHARVSDLLVDTFSIGIGLLIGGMQARVPRRI